MERRFALTLTLLFLTIAPLQARQVAPAQNPVARGEPSPARWENAIAKIEATGNRAPGGIVFTGSSSIAKWTTLAEDFPGLPVQNHGFSGSLISDVTYYVDRIVIPYKPRLVVFYAGDNDLGTGHTPEQVAADFKTFFAKVRKALPKTRIAFISIKPSLQRANVLEPMRTANALIREWLGKQENVAYIDVFTPMLDSEGRIRPDLYVEDGLHMNRKGYEIWTKAVAPYLRDI
jgi:lysophospholipase L1-like esterase